MPYLLGSGTIMQRPVVARRFRFPVRRGMRGLGDGATFSLRNLTTGNYYKAGGWLSFAVGDDYELSVDGGRPFDKVTLTPATRAFSAGGTVGMTGNWVVSSTMLSVDRGKTTVTIAVNGQSIGSFSYGVFDPGDPNLLDSPQVLLSVSPVPPVTGPTPSGASYIADPAVAAAMAASGVPANTPLTAAQQQAFWDAYSSQLAVPESSYMATPPLTQQTLDMWAYMLNSAANAPSVPIASTGMYAIANWTDELKRQALAWTPAQQAQYGITPQIAAQWAAALTSDIAAGLYVPQSAQEIPAGIVQTVSPTTGQTTFSVSPTALSAPSTVQIPTPASIIGTPFAAKPVSVTPFSTTPLLASGALPVAASPTGALPASAAAAAASTDAAMAFLSSDVGGFPMWGLLGGALLLLVVLGKR